MEKISVSSEGSNLETGKLECIKIYHLRHPEDRIQFAAFSNHLSTLRRKVLSSFLDTPGGEEQYSYLKSQFADSDVITLFLSSHFDEAYSTKEMINLLKEYAAKGKYIWPIIARSYYWEDTELGQFPIFFGDDKPIASIRDQDEIFKQLIAKIDSEVTLMLADKWVQEGNKYDHQRLFEKALIAYKASSQHISNYPPAIFGQGKTLQKMHRLEEARQYFDAILSQCSQIQPQDSQIQSKGKDILSSAKNRLHVTLDLISTCYKGHVLLAQEKLDEALLAYRNVLMMIDTPTDIRQKQLCAQAYCGEGDAYQQLGRQESNLEQALDAYYKAKGLDPINPIYLDRIGQICLLMSTHSQSNLYFEQAQETYKLLLRYHPKHSLGYVGQGNILYYSHHYQAAFDAYMQAIQLDPHETRAYSGKGYALLASGNPEKALTDFDKALILEPNNAYLHYGKGQALASLERYREASESYQRVDHYKLHQAANFFLHYAETLLALGKLASTCGDLQAQAVHYYEKATDYYYKSTEHGGSEQDQYFGLGKTYFAGGIWATAQLFFNNAMTHTPTMAEAYLEMGKTCIEMERTQEEAYIYFEDARQYCRNAISKIDEADVETAFGDAHYRTAERSLPQINNEALNISQAHYEKANSLHERAPAFVGLGKILMLRYHYKEAIDTFDRALELQPRLVECYFLKGKCYYELNRYDMAYDMYKIYKEALSTNIHVVPLQLQKMLSDTLLAMKRYPDAIDILDDMIMRMLKIEDMREDVANAYGSKGTAFERQGRYQEALYCLIRAYEFDKSIPWQIQYGSTLQEIHFSFERTLRSNPKNAFIHKCIGEILILKERPEDAINAYNQAIIHGDRSADIYYRRGYAYEQCKEYQRAFDEYSEALNIDPKNQYAQQGKTRLASYLENIVYETEQNHNGFLKRFISWFKPFRI